jgi:hypothetical protein
MSNVNSYNGFWNLPVYTLTDTNEHALLVPSAAGIYPGLPCPEYPASSGICIPATYDLPTGGTLDGHAFCIQLVGLLANPGAGNLTIKLYQVPYASLGTISATGSVTSAGAPGSGDNNVDSIAFTTPASGHFQILWTLMWDSTVAKLDGTHIGQVNNATVAFANVGTQLTSGVASSQALNFLVSFTFATGNAGNSVTVKEFSMERY